MPPTIRVRDYERTAVSEVSTTKAVTIIRLKRHLRWNVSGMKLILNDKQSSRQGGLLQSNYSTRSTKMFPFQKRSLYQKPNICLWRAMVVDTWPAFFPRSGVWIPFSVENNVSQYLRPCWGSPRSSPAFTRAEDVKGIVQKSFGNENRKSQKLSHAERAGGVWTWSRKSASSTGISPFLSRRGLPQISRMYQHNWNGIEQLFSLVAYNLSEMSWLVHNNV